MRIAIIETGAPPDPLQKRHGDYPAMMMRMLTPLAPRLDFFTVRISDGGAPPSIDAFGGVLVTGSPAGVYDGHDWIAPLEDLLRKAAAAGKRQVGICFGHQVMAQAFGGKVAKSDKGWGVGLHRYEVRARTEWMSPETARLACAVSHQDQVVEAPPGAKVIAGSAFCPNGALAYAQGRAVSFQMHPEFEHDFAADLLRLRKDRIAEPLVKDGLESLSGASDRATLAQWIANFFTIA